MRAGRELVGHDAEGEDVGARVDRLPAQLLGRHVAGRAELRAGQRQPGLRRPARRRQVPRDAEVHDLDAARLSLQQHVLGLEIAMDDAVAVRRVERFGDLGQGVEQPLAWKRAGRERRRAASFRAPARWR